MDDPLLEPVVLEGSDVEKEVVFRTVHRMALARATTAASKQFPQPFLSERIDPASPEAAVR
jgi:hypothetical protein